MLIAALLNCLFLILLNVRRRKNNPATDYYIALLAVLAFGLTSTFGGQIVILSTTGLNLILGPLILGYVKTYIAGRREKVLSLFHYAPALVLMIGMPFLILLPDALSLRIENILWILIHIQALLYGYFSSRLVYKARKKIEQSYADESTLHFRWLRIFTIVYSVIWFVSFGTVLFSQSRSIISLLIVLSIFLYGYYTETYRYIGRPIPEDSFSKEEFLDTLEIDVQNLTAYMEENAPWKDSQLTLQSLSQQVGIPQYRVSKAIHSISQMNFFNYINSCRVEMACSLIAENQKDLTILDIAYESGFGSKSTFNYSFRKITGKTPTQYKKSTT